MAYTPTTWTPGTLGTEITAARLNNLETGVDTAHDLIAALAASANKLTAETVTTSGTMSATPKAVVEVNAASPVTLTLPAVDDGTAVEIFQGGAGSVTVAGDSGVAVWPAPPSTGLTTAGQRASMYGRFRGGAPVTSPPATNMIMRFRADDLSGANGSAVSSWAESSGQGHPAAVQATSGNQPTVATNSGSTGHKGVSFNGSSSFLTLSGSALNVARNRGSLCVFAAVVFPFAVTTGTRTLYALSTGTSSTASRVLLGHRDSVSGLPIAGGRRLDANSLASVTGTVINTVQNAVLAGRFLFSSSDLYLYQNGTQTGSSTSFQTDGLTSDTASLAGVIGANLAGTGEWFQGHLLELLVYLDSDSTGTLRSGVDSYFQQTYGISSSDAVTAGEWIMSGGVA